MNDGLAVHLAGLAALLPGAAYALRGRGRGSVAYAVVLGLALAGAALVILADFAGGWDSGFSTALWLTVLSSLLLFALLALAVPDARPLALILLPYAFLLGLLATIWQGQGEVNAGRLAAEAQGSWLAVHIPASLATYGLLTIAAAAALAVLLQESSLRRKHRREFVARLPAIATCEKLEIRLLVAAEAVLLVGVITGMAALYVSSGRLLVLDHKTALSIMAFLVVGAVLLMHALAGIRGRIAARLLLVAYLILTLAYPGVKFVLDVLMTG